MPGLKDAALALAAKSRRPAPFAGPFIPLHPAAVPTHGPDLGPGPGPDGNLSNLPPCVAVDGSHAVLVDNGALWVVAFRAATILWPGPPCIEPESAVVATSSDEAQAKLDVLYAGWGMEAPSAGNAESFAAALRSLEEARLSVQAISGMARDSLLLVDGALQGLPPIPQTLSDRILAAADRAGVHVVGVSKRSGLAEEGVSVVQAAQRSGPPGAWAVQLRDGVFVARLHARAAYAFRVDAQDHTQVARLLPYCRDAVYTGYPYPLALAHNTVALTGAHARELRGRLVDEVRRAGGASAAALLADFHETLDLNV